MAYAQQRGNRWTGYYRIGSKRLSVGTYDTELEAKYEALRAEKDGSYRPSRASNSLSTHLQNWLQNAHIQPITRKGYQSLIARFISPRIGDLALNRVDRRVVIDLLDDLKAEGVGSATIAQVKACLGSAFSKAVMTGEVESNPTHGIKIKVGHGDIENVLEPEDFKSIIKSLPNKETQLFARFLVTSGCRFGEATELRVKDINFKTGEVFVQRRVSDLGASYNNGVRFVVVEATKSGKKRSLTISKTYLQEIKQYVTAKALSKEDLLFPRSIVSIENKLEPSLGAKSGQPFALDGKLFKHGTLYAYTHGKCRCGECRMARRKQSQKAKPYQKPYQKQEHFINQTGHLPRDVWRIIWNKAIAKSGIGWSPRTHDLRHANATQLLKSGVDIHEVKERLGHRSVKTTERYLHRLRHNKSEAGEFANDYLE